MRGSEITFGLMRREYGMFCCILLLPNRPGYVSGLHLSHGDPGESDRLVCA